jgi:hypothetical protein
MASDGEPVTIARLATKAGVSRVGDLLIPPFDGVPIT